MVVMVAAVVVEVVMRVVVALVSWIASSQYLASIYPEMPQIFSENQKLILKPMISMKNHDFFYFFCKTRFFTLFLLLRSYISVNLRLGMSLKCP